MARWTWQRHRDIWERMMEIERQTFSTTTLMTRFDGVIFRNIQVSGIQLVATKRDHEKWNFKTFLKQQKLKTDKTVDDRTNSEWSYFPGRDGVDSIFCYLLAIKANDLHLAELLKDYSLLLLRDHLESNKKSVDVDSAITAVKEFEQFVSEITALIPELCNKEDFNSLTSREKWDTYKEAVGVWKCPKCQNLIPEGPQRCSPFPGASIKCEECDCELTARTGGGQCDPFRYRLCVE